MTIRVVVVDDDDVTRLGTTMILDGHPDIEVIAALNHVDAAESMGTWTGVDVAMIDAADHRRLDDQFPGVGIVQALRLHRSPEQTRVVILTGIMFDDAVRRRMREANADFYFHRSELLDAASVWAAVLDQNAQHRVPRPHRDEALHRLGVTDGSRVNDGVQSAGREGFLGGDPLLARRGRDRTRRRERFNAEARLNPVTADGLIPDRHQVTPSLPQIERFLHWATRVRDRDQPGS